MSVQTFPITECGFVMIVETTAIVECVFSGVRGFLCRPYRTLCEGGTCLAELVLRAIVARSCRPFAAICRGDLGYIGSVLRTFRRPFCANDCCHVDHPTQFAVVIWEILVRSCGPFAAHFVLTIAVLGAFLGRYCVYCIGGRGDASQ